MTITPDPQIVRSLARRFLLADDPADDDLYYIVRSHTGYELPDGQFKAWLDAVQADADRATVAKTVEWPDDPLPDEQDDPFAMIAEDCPAGPARAVAEHWFSHAAPISDSVGGPEWAAIADMTLRILDLLDEEQVESGERDGYAVRLLDMLEADPDRFQESEEDDLRTALSALFQHTAEAANLATALAEAQAERDGATQAVAEAVSILEGMLNEDAWAYDAGRARNVLLDYFARDLDALKAANAKAGE